MGIRPDQEHVRQPAARDRRYLTALTGWGYKPSEVEQLMLAEPALRTTTTTTTDSKDHTEDATEVTAPVEDEQGGQEPQSAEDSARFGTRATRATTPSTTRRVMWVMTVTIDAATARPVYITALVVREVGAAVRASGLISSLLDRRLERDVQPRKRFDLTPRRGARTTGDPDVCSAAHPVAGP